MVRPNSYPNLTGFGSTMHGVYKVPPLRHAIFTETNEWRRGTSVRQFDYYYIQKKAFTAPIYYTTPESQRIQARQKWKKKIELLNEYNKIDFFSKGKGTRVCDGFLMCQPDLLVLFEYRQDSVWHCAQVHINRQHPKAKKTPSALLAQYPPFLFFCLALCTWSGTRKMKTAQMPSLRHLRREAARRGGWSIICVWKWPLVSS